MGTIIEDNGNSSLLLQLENRKRPILVHKGMVFVKKLTDAWRLLQGTNRNFIEFPNEKEGPTSEPVAHRTRSKKGTTDT